MAGVVLPQHALFDQSLHPECLLLSCFHHLRLMLGTRHHQIQSRRDEVHGLAVAHLAVAVGVAREQPPQRVLALRGRAGAPCDCIDSQS